MRRLLLLVPCSLFVTNFLSGCNHQRQSSNYGNATQISHDGAYLQKSGVLSTSDYQRLTIIGNKAVTGDTLTDGEVDWSLSLIQRPGTDYQKSQRMLYLTSALANSKRGSFPTSRREAMFQFAVQAANHTGTPIGISYFGCLLLGNLKDKRGLAYLKPLLASDDIHIQHAARRAIHTLSEP